MKVLILGSTGFLGRVLLKKALDRRYEVRTMVRSPEKLGELKENVEFVVGDIFNPQDIEQAVAGVNVVISAVGPPQKKPGNPDDYKKAMENLVGSLRRNGITRFIHTGGAVHDGGEDEEWSIRRRILRLVLDVVFKPGLEAKRLEWEVSEELRP